MSEQANPSPQERPEIRKFKSEYADAMSKARISEEHTATQGWQDLYGDHRESIRKQQIEISDRLKAMSETVRVRLFTEDEEKEIGELKKKACEIRSSDD